MQIIHDLKSWHAIRSSIDKTLSIGFVATMGALHEGHGSLLKIARENNEIVVLSIFVNPTQFNNREDFGNYPICLEQDIAFARLHEIDYLLLPTEQELYPNANTFYLETSHLLANKFEGEYRPGHFSGVLTIVMKLLQLVQAHKAYFGEKDYQQLILIKEMVASFFIHTQIIGCPIKREQSGLPYSSRNKRLTIKQKKLAHTAYAILCKSVPDKLADTTKALQALDITIDYLAYDQDRIFSAIKIGDIRLIDNFIIEEKIKDSLCQKL